ncbi:MAG: hypothetical protein R2724_29605 [Bryobacterales bacterium]
MVEEIARGVEHTVHVYVDALGRCLCAVPCRRLEVRSEKSRRSDGEAASADGACPRDHKDLAGRAPGRSSIQIFG